MKTFLKWREPKFVRRTRHFLEWASLPVWFRPLLVLVFVDWFMFIWLLGQFDPKRNQPSAMFAFLKSFIVSIFLVYVLPGSILLFARLFPSSIRVTDVAVVLNEGGFTTKLDYSCIQSCRIASECTEEGISVLEVSYSAKEDLIKTLIVGIDPTVSLDEIQHTLTQCGVAVTRVDLLKQKSTGNNSQEGNSGFST